MDDLVAHLRALAIGHDNPDIVATLHQSALQVIDRAADRIESLQRRAAELTDALSELVMRCAQRDDPDRPFTTLQEAQYSNALNKARRAL